MKTRSRSKRLRVARPLLFSLLAALLLGLLAVAVRRRLLSTRSGVHGGAHDHPRRVENREPARDLLKRLTDPAFAARVSEVRLFGFLERPDVASRLSLEEHAFWPDRYERRVIESGWLSWIRMNPNRLLASRGPTQGSPALPASLIRLRLRSLLVIRHLANAVARGTPPEPFDRKGEQLQALKVEDAYGSFRILLGGLAGGLQGVQDGPEAVYFTAQVRSGPWMFPATQAAVSGDQLVEIVRVTSTETVPRER